MATFESPVLRGFDSYELKLGDELRGHRATKGKSLLDVQRDLRIKASYIEAIENCDVSVFPNKGYVAGYVRAYARYLGLDAEDVYARFCEEGGFVSETGRLLSKVEERGRAPKVYSKAARDPSLSKSYFAAPIGRAPRIGLGVSLSGVASVAVLCALIFGLGYGAWAVLENVQRVGFAPTVEAPEAVESVPNIAAPGLTTLPPRGQSFEVAGRSEALVNLYAPPDLDAPKLELRDGPIAAIDPEAAGVFAAPAADKAPVVELTAASETATAALRLEQPGPAEAAQPLAAVHTGIGLVVTDEAWIQVMLPDGSRLVERIFQRGERFQLPDDIDQARLRAGNAAGVFIEVDGVLHGPLGGAGKVVKNVALDRASVQAAYPAAAPEVAAAVAPAATEQRAEAELPRE